MLRDFGRSRWQWHHEAMTRARYEVYLLRHADAGDPIAWQGDDADRPLSRKGTRQAERLGAFLARIGFKTDATLSSPKTRARETAEIVAEAIGGEVTLDERLAAGFGLEALAAALDEAARSNDDTAADRSRILLVGHDPDFSAVLSELCDASSFSLAKGALARVDLDGPPEPGAGRLRWLVPPDALKPSI